MDNVSSDQDQEQQGDGPFAEQDQLEILHPLRCAFVRAQEREDEIEGGARLVHRKDVRETGVVMPVTRKGTCVPDTLATIISDIWLKENCRGTQLPNGSFVGPDELQGYLRNSLSPNGDWVKLKDAVAFLPSLGFKAERMTRDENGYYLFQNKVAVLTCTQGHFWIVCELTGNDKRKSTHSVSYLAEKRWFVDNWERAKALELTNDDITALHNPEGAKKKANKLFKRRLGEDYRSIEIVRWYKIVRSHQL